MLKVSAQIFVNALPEFLEAVRAAGQYTYAEYIDLGDKPYISEISPESEYCQPLPGMHVWFDKRYKMGTALSCILPFHWNEHCSLASVTKTRKMILHGRTNGWNTQITFKTDKDSCLLISDPKIIDLWEEIQRKKEHP